MSGQWAFENRPVPMQTDIAQRIGPWAAEPQAL
jgi:hypothetical protein